MISFAPLNGHFRKLFRISTPDFLSNIADKWDIAPAETKHVPPAIFLDGQLDKIRATEFAPLDVVIRSFRGSFDAVEAPTSGYRLRNVDLVDGVLYARGRQRHLRSRTSRALAFRRPQAIESGALFESWLGNRWFGNWLSDDCLTYPLTQEFGEPVTTSPSPSGHVPQYEAKLDMSPKRIKDAHFEDLVLFDDASNNADKANRATEMRDKLLLGRKSEPARGVFLVRGTSGDARVLENEREIAENLASFYGFHVLDSATASVDQIVDTCGHASIIAGVEGSHLVHGLVAMPNAATLLVIQPPDRTVAALKTLTDRQGQGYAFVVADGTQNRFRASWEDVRRTVDLIDE